jgi:hypothetical protein
MSGRDMILIGYLIIGVIIWIGKTIENDTTHFMTEPTPPSISAIFWPLWVALGIIYVIASYAPNTKDQDHV